MSAALFLFLWFAFHVCSTVPILVNYFSCLEHYSLSVICFSCLQHCSYSCDFLFMSSALFLFWWFAFHVCSTNPILAICFSCLHHCSYSCDLLFMTYTTVPILVNCFSWPTPLFLFVWFSFHVCSTFPILVIFFSCLQHCSFPYDLLCDPVWFCSSSHLCKEGAGLYTEPKDKFNKCISA